MKGFWSAQQQRLILFLFALVVFGQVLNIWIQSREPGSSDLSPPTHATE